MNVNGNPLEVCSLDPVTGYTEMKALLCHISKA